MFSAPWPVLGRGLKGGGAGLILRPEPGACTEEKPAMIVGQFTVTFLVDCPAPSDPHRF